MSATALSQPISSTQASWLLVRLRMQRWANLMNLASRRDVGRQGVPAKRVGGMLLALLAGGCLAMVFIVSALGSVRNITGQVITGGGGGGGVQGREALGIALNLSISMLAALFIEGGARQFSGQPEWDLEWLVTLPAPLEPLLMGRIIDRSITNLLGFLTLAPTLGWLMWQVHGTRWAPAVALLVALPLCLLIGTVQTVIDTGLRLRVSAPQLRNIQALMSVAGMIGIYVGISASATVPSVALRMVEWAPGFLAWTPPGLAVAAVATQDVYLSLSCALLLCLETAGFMVAGFGLLLHWLHLGVASGGAREGGRRGARAAASTAPSTADWLGPVARREVRLLARDRNYLVQTLVVPVLILTFQTMLRMTRTGQAAQVGPTLMAAVAFGVAAHALMFSAFQTLIHEGQSLWLLYCVPKPLDVILRHKAMFWCAVVSIFPAGLLLYSLATTHGDWAAVGLALFAAAGVPIYAMLAGAMGVLGSNPLEDQPRRRLKVGTMYQYLLLAGVYIYAIETESLWRRVTLFVLMVAVAMALWEKARDRLPYLLDPVASPPSRMSLADGLLAALMFLVLQDGVVWMFSGSNGHVPDQRALLTGSVVAGGCTWAVLRSVYWRSRTQHVPALWTPGTTTYAMFWGVAVGCVAGAAAVMYLTGMLRWSVFMDVLQMSLDTSRVSTPLVVLAVFAAPLFEEFLFRGIVFTGMRRLLPTWQAAAMSAWVFAMAHPALSAAPVWLLGFGCALAYARTHSLLAPIVAHTLYNAMVLALQWQN